MAINPRTKQEIFEDIKEYNKKPKQITKNQSESTPLKEPPKYKKGFDHGLQDSSDD